MSACVTARHGSFGCVHTAIDAQVCWALRTHPRAACRAIGGAIRSAVQKKVQRDGYCGVCPEKKHLDSVQKGRARSRTSKGAQRWGRRAKEECEKLGTSSMGWRAARLHLGKHVITIGEPDAAANIYHKLFKHAPHVRVAQNVNRTSRRASGGTRCLNCSPQPWHTSVLAPTLWRAKSTKEDLLKAGHKSSHGLSGCADVEVARHRSA
eukprot:scaffold142055_cov36-Tisochrysis_lutea.AAC.1